MPELTVILDMEGRGMEQGLDALTAKLSDLSYALGAAGRHMMGSVAANFASGGRPEKWAPLKPDTIRAKGGDAPLVRTGALSGSVNFKAGPDTLVVSADVPYAWVQQHGADGIPPRPFLVFQPEDVDAITSLAAGAMAAV